MSTHAFHRLSVIVFVATVGTVSCMPMPFCHGMEPLGASDNVNRVKSKDMTPEDVLRAMFIASLSKDEEALRRLVLPNPDIKYLYEGLEASTEDQKEHLKRITTYIKNAKYRRLKVGEIVIPPRTTVRIKITRKHVADNKVALLDEGLGVPFFLVRQEGVWKVDASALIAARKAVRERAKKDETK